MDNLVIGLGEIGTALTKILKCDGIDRDTKAEHKTYKYIHICFPYSENFVEYVRQYQELYSPKLTIIHSTVPVGTSRQCNAVHSPVRGIHPYLEDGIRTFVKYFGGKDAYEASLIFSELGIKIGLTFNSENTEAMKLWDTTIYGVNILLEKEIYEYCKINGLDFDFVYTNANKTYNDGYEKLGFPQFKKYILKHIEGKIGGHCILPNIELLKSKVVDWFYD